MTYPLSSTITANQPIDFNKPGITLDPAQEAAVAHFQRLYCELTAPQPKPGIVDRLLNRKQTLVKGLYLWGGVGRGKTFLMDHFFEALPLAEKKRLHFHRFMLGIHADLQALPKSPDPLRIVAQHLASKMRVLCLDEFHVHDIGDAMLLGRLLETLFEHNVTLITTSNTQPDELYRNGLQRDRFLPAIALLKTHTEEFQLDHDTDYRTRLLEQAGVYHLNDESDSHAQLAQHFSKLAPEPTMASRHGIEINNRIIETVEEGEDVVWFSFEGICNTPRSSADYLEISRLYHTVIVSDIPQLGEALDSAVQRFIHMIDAFYDHNVNVIISAAAPAIGLYQGHRHTFAFKRTISRLQEMASHEYLQRPHRA